MSECFVGIDTSNYTTSAAIADEQGEILANLKMPLPVKAGEVGLRQSEAVFAHVKNLPVLMERLQGELRGHTVSGVGVSSRPRDAEDSYMPCFLAGVAAATAFASGLDVPVYRFSHQDGHLMAAMHASGKFTELQGKKFGAFHVSGGTTEMLSVMATGTDFSVKRLGGTADLNAGQAIDRIGLMLGLCFPCGPELEKLAQTNITKIPPVNVSVKEGVCNLSGLENKASALYQQTADPALTAAYTLRFIACTLEKMALCLRKEEGEIPILFAGGVMGNRMIAAYLTEKLGNVAFATPAFSADNAAGIALLCRAKMAE